jgi:hypothetical protein
VKGIQASEDAGFWIENVWCRVSLAVNVTGVPAGKPPSVIRSDQATEPLVSVGAAPSWGQTSSGPEVVIAAALAVSVPRAARPETLASPVWLHTTVPEGMVPALCADGTASATLLTPFSVPLSKP